MELLKRKNFTDIVPLMFSIVVLFGLAVFAVILYNAYNDNIKDNLNEALTSSTPVDSNANVTAILEDTSSGIGKLNPLFPFLMIGLFAFTILTALMGRSHPMFLFIGLIVIGIILIIAATFTNVYEGIVSNTHFADEDTEFTIIGIILGNLPIITFILFIIIAIILYGSKEPVGGRY